MLKELIKYSSFFALLFSLVAFSPKQDNGVAADTTKNGKIKIEARNYSDMSVEMADVWYQNGKIYVVVATLSSVLAGFIIYLIITDRRVRKLEEEIKNGL